MGIVSVDVRVCEAGVSVSGCKWMKMYVSVCLGVCMSVHAKCTLIFMSRLLLRSTLCFCILRRNTVH